MRRRDDAPVRLHGASWKEKFAVPTNLKEYNKKPFVRSCSPSKAFSTPRQSIGTDDGGTADARPPSRSASATTQRGASFSRSNTPTSQTQTNGNKPPFRAGSPSPNLFMRTNSETSAQGRSVSAQRGYAGGHTPRTSRSTTPRDMTLRNGAGVPSSTLALGNGSSPSVRKTLVTYRAATLADEKRQAQSHAVERSLMMRYGLVSRLVVPGQSSIALLSNLNQQHQQQQLRGGSPEILTARRSASRPMEMAEDGAACLLSEGMWRHLIALCPLHSLLKLAAVNTKLSELTDARRTELEMKEGEERRVWRELRRAEDAVRAIPRPFFEALRGLKTQPSTRVLSVLQLACLVVDPKFPEVSCDQAWPHTQRTLQDPGFVEKLLQTPLLQIAPDRAALLRTLLAQYESQAVEGVGMQHAHASAIQTWVSRFMGVHKTVGSDGDHRRPPATPRGPQQPASLHRTNSNASPRTPRKR